MKEGAAIQTMTGIQKGWQSPNCLNAQKLLLKATALPLPIRRLADLFDLILVSSFLLKQKSLATKGNPGSGPG
jgi:hypothetical protein